jgi:hypothetical protein
MWLFDEVELVIYAPTALQHILKNLEYVTEFGKQG